MNIISINTNETTYKIIIPISKKKKTKKHINNFSFEITHSKGMKVSTVHLSEVEADFNDIDESFESRILTIKQNPSIQIKMCLFFLVCHNLNSILN